MEGGSRKEGQFGEVSEVVTEAFRKHSEERVFLQQMFLVLHRVEI